VVRTICDRRASAVQNYERELICAVKGIVRHQHKENKVNNNVLILGGGVAGSSMAYYLSEKGYEVTVVEKNSRVGGLARTCYYSGHPYEFGPHIWFWPGGPEDPINNTVVKLTGNELFHIDRRLFTYVEADGRKYRYPVHYEDIDQMPERQIIHQEVRKNRDDNLKLIERKLPELGKCKFADYFSEAIGDTLYQKFMANYTWKMWNIPGNELETSMVWADRFHHAYTKKDEKTRGLAGYDPLKFEDHTLGKGIRFQVYPKGGWNSVWNAMVSRSKVVRDQVTSIQDEHKQPYILMRSGEKYYFADYHTVFCSIDLDELWGEDTLPYTGRMMIPLLIPGLTNAFPEGSESIHYSSCEFQTRVTEMKVITRHNSPDTLILIEVPVLPGAATCFPKNASDYAAEHNLITEKAYPQQSEKAFASYYSYVDRGKKIPNLRYVGRHAEFKYWGMPETVNSAYQKSLEFSPM
jgi:UDP-galactopyranose mutase